MSLPYGRMAGDGAFALLGAAVSNGCLLASTLLAVRAFPGGGGESDHFFLLNGVFVLGVLSANLGIPSAATKLLAGNRPGGRGPGIVSATFRLAAAAAVCAVSAVAAYAYFVSGNPLILRDIIPLCLCILFFAPGKWIAGVLQGLGILRAASAYEASFEVLRLGVLLGALQAGGGSGAVVWGWAGVAAVHLAGGAFLLRSALGRSPAAPSSGGPTAPGPAPGALLALSLSLFLPFAGLFALTQGFTILLAERGAVGDASRWAVGLQLASLLTLIAGPLGTVLLPHFARAAVRGQEARLLAAVRPILVRAGLLLAGAAAALMLGAGPLLGLLFGSASPDASSAHHAPAVPGVAAVRILASVYLLEAFKFVLDPLLIALGRWKPLAGIEAARLVFAFAAGYWAVGHWSLEGAISALAAAVILASAGKWALYAGAGKPGAEREVHALG